ncbi:MAG TPA: hypothetical protein VLG25_02780 [Patescibacteria group bacterium]|nr:hypothetical protein [Patescibacteria group bacterium]
MTDAQASQSYETLGLPVLPAFEAAENTGTELYVDRTIDLLHSPGFEARFVTLHTAAEVAELQAARDRLDTDANQQARAAVRLIASQELGLDIATAQRLGGVWHETVMNVSRRPVDDTTSLSLKKYLFEQYRDLAALSDVFHQRVAAAEAEVELVARTKLGELSDIKAELSERRNDPSLLQAAALWANSPDSQDGRAEDGQGYNAGLIHFFEYRSAAAKRRRFRVMDEPVTVDGFITLSHRLYRELVDPVLPEPNRRAVLEDSDGNRRLYVLCPNGEFIVAFQSCGEPLPRMTSMINQVTDAYFDKVVAECLRGDDRGRLNKLGPVVSKII